LGFQRSGIGPETFYYREMVEMIAREIGSSALIVAMPPMLAYQGVRVLGWMGVARARTRARTQVVPRRQIR